MSSQQDLYNLIHNKQEKMVYYLFALAVTSIGFAVYNTIGKPLSYSQVPLGAAVLFWGFSLLCGFKYLGYSMNSMQANYQMFMVEQGRNKEVGNDAQKKEIAISAILEVIVSNNKKSIRLFNAQQYLFYAGIMAFLVWHILEMYINNLHL